MFSLSFYGGVNEIGGNKILLEDEGTRVFLDFGMSFGMRGKFYEEYLNPRVGNGLGDFFEMGLTPDITGIYRSDLLELAGREAEEPSVDAVLLSHAHADHANYISFLHQEIPIYCGETALLILEAVSEAGKGSIENEVVYFKERPYERGDVEARRRFTAFRSGRKFKIGTLEVVPVHVDHSVPGAYGFVIHTSEGAVVYTGDLRLHGTSPRLTQDFVERAKEEKPEVMLTEGTKINVEKTDESEKKVKETCLELLSKTRNFAAVDFNFKDVDRLRTFYSIAKETGRKFAVSLKDAFFLKWLSEDKKLGVPSPRDENVAIYIPKRVNFTANEKQFLEYGNATSSAEIGKRQGEFLCSLGFFDMGELIDVKPVGGMYIRSMSEDLNEEMVIDTRKLNNWLEHFKLAKHFSHCSGHAPKEDLLALAREISPKKLIPIHTEHAEIFAKELGGIKVEIPEIS